MNHDQLRDIKRVLREQHKARAQRVLRLRAAERREEEVSFKTEVARLSVTPLRSK
jgi:hypothetical protein